MVSEEAFDRDPLRVLRLARFAAGLGFEPDEATIAAAAKRAARIGDVAQERVFGELKQLAHERCGALDGLALMDRLGLTEQRAAGARSRCAASSRTASTTSTSTTTRSRCSRP